MYDAEHAVAGRRVSFDASGGRPQDHQNGSRAVETQLRVSYD